MANIIDFEKYKNYKKIKTNHPKIFDISEKDLVIAYRQHKAILHRVCFGFMLVGYEKDGYFCLEAAKTATPIRGEAEALHVEEVIKSWSIELEKYRSNNKI